MAKRRPEQTEPVSESKFASEPEELEDEPFTEIDGSPVPGLALRHVLRGHSGINRIAWSPDGRHLASPSDDKTIRLWDAHSGVCVHILQGHTAEVNSVAWSPDGETLASGSHDCVVRLWNFAQGQLLRKLEGHSGIVTSVSWSPDGKTLASTSDDETIRIWAPENEQPTRIIKGPGGWVTSAVWSPDGNMLVSGCGDSAIRFWDVRNGELVKTLTGHTGRVTNLAWSPDRKTLVSTSVDATLRIWDFATGRQIRILEDHTATVRSASFSFDGRILASNSWDLTVRLRRSDRWESVAVLREPVWNNWGASLAFHPTLPVLATLGEQNTVIRVWDIDIDLLLGSNAIAEYAHYTTAKLVLVGDSGVGKTGLGWRLAHDEFKEQSSTHGQQFWPVKQLGFKRADGTECEAVLWDLAGQPVYRQVHSIFLENIAAALILFDPSNRQEPLKGVQFWLEQLTEKGQLPPAVLIGARVDRGAPTLSQQELDQFCQRYGIRGGYVSTSAFSGEGLDTLLKTLKQQIPWEEMTATVTTVTFKRIKDYVLALKEKPDREGVLVSPPMLREQLQATDQDWRFTDDEMMTAVGHLETHGYVAVLHSSAGEQHILLTPELLVTLAASIVLLADKNPRELGAVSESELLRGAYPSAELLAGITRRDWNADALEQGAVLPSAESQILLDAAVRRFLQHNICFRETLDNDTLLIFPILIKQKRPLQDDLHSTDDISYVVRGRVENLYASLVVLLGYTPSFTRINQWQNQAQYEMAEGQVCGFRLIEDREGEIEIVLYYGDRLPAHGRTQFQELFEHLLYQRDVEVTRFPPVVCPKGHRQERATIIKRVREGKRFVHCEECGNKTDLTNFDQPQTIGIAASLWLQCEEASARLRSNYEVQLTSIKSYRRGWATPRCYVSHMDEQSMWAKELIKDLCDAGVYVVEQAANVQPDDFVVVLDTSAYQKAFRTPILAADEPLIRARWGKRQLMSLALMGQAGGHEFKDCQPGSFRDETHYPVSLFDLVLNLYAIPLTHTGFAPLRQILHTQWEETLAPKRGVAVTSSLKVFISYAHKDEEFKDELVTMLAGLQRQGIIDAWQDRRIEEGDEWYQAIQDAMNGCDLAILLVSQHFIASRFIQDDELPRLLQRRNDAGLRVVPIIVRPCKWQSEPALKGLQGLPKDGKAVITFDKDNGDRDQVWTDIATVIEQRAKTKV